MNTQTHPTCPARMRFVRYPALTEAVLEVAGVGPCDVTITPSAGPADADAWLLLELSGPQVMDHLDDLNDDGDGMRKFRDPETFAWDGFDPRDPNNPVGTTPDPLLLNRDAARQLGELLIRFADTGRLQPPPGEAVEDRTY